MIKDVNNWMYWYNYYLFMIVYFKKRTFKIPKNAFNINFKRRQ